MFLRQLSLKNIRSLRDITVDFSCDDAEGVRQWTCILGENGCGKSTILRAAALLLAGSDSLAEIVGNVNRWITNGTDAASIEAVIETQAREQRVVSLELRRGMAVSDLIKHNSDNLAALDAALKHAARNYFVAGYGVSRRLSLSGLSSAEVYRGPRTQAFGTLFSPDAVLRSLDAWAMDLEYRRGARGLNVIKHAISDLLPDVDFARVDREQRQLLFKTKDGLVPLEELSDGYQNVAAWCGDLLYRLTEVFDNYKNPLHARGLLLLDEVDLHLHPVWQRQLVHTLRERLPNFQIITTTHSPLTAQQSGEGELYILRREADQPVLFHYEGAPNLLRVDQLLVSPVFGLTTGASVKVETLRKKQWQGKALEKEERELLRDVPRPRADAHSENEKIALLRAVRDALAESDSAKKKARHIRPSAGQVVRRALKKK